MTVHACMQALGRCCQVMGSGIGLAYFEISFLCLDLNHQKLIFHIHMYTNTVHITVQLV